MDSTKTVSLNPRPERGDIEIAQFAKNNTELPIFISKDAHIDIAMNQDSTTNIGDSAIYRCQLSISATYQRIIVV